MQTQEEEKREKARLAAKKYRETHKEKIKRDQKKYRETHKQQSKEYHDNYYQENIEKFQEYSKQQYENNKDEIIGRSREYYLKNKRLIKEQRDLHKGEKSLYNKKHYLNNRDELLEYHRKQNKTLRGRFRTTKGHAKKRNLEFNLTFEQYSEIAIKPCYYCNDHFRIEIGTGSGIDRVINTEGYHINNIVSCCAHCNYLKRNIYNVEQTKAMVDTLIKLEVSMTSLDTSN